MNQKSETLCTIIKEQVLFWEASNNIESYTHYCDISESVNQDIFTEDEKQLIESKLLELYALVKLLNKSK